MPNTFSFFRTTNVIIRTLRPQKYTFNTVLLITHIEPRFLMLDNNQNSHWYGKMDFGENYFCNTVSHFSYAPLKNVK